MLGLVNFGLFHMPRLTYNPITNHKWEWEWEGMGIAHTGMYDVAVLTIALSCTIFDLFHVQNIVILKSRLKVNQVYWKWHHLIDRIKFLFIFHCKYVSIFYGSVTEIFSVEYWRHLEIWVRASFFFLSFLFGVANAPFACQRWGLPHRLAQCTTPGKHNKIIYFISRWRKVFSTVLLSHRCILKVERSKVKVKDLAKSFCCNSAALPDDKNKMFLGGTFVVPLLNAMIRFQSSKECAQHSVHISRRCITFHTSQCAQDRFAHAR